MTAESFLFPIYPRLPPVVVSPYGVAIPLGLACAFTLMLVGFLFRERLARSLAGLRPWLLHGILFTLVAIAVRLGRQHGSPSAPSVPQAHQPADLFYWNQN